MHQTEDEMKRRIDQLEQQINENNTRDAHPAKRTRLSETTYET
jgi:hypothetical protein